MLTLLCRIEISIRLHFVQLRHEIIVWLRHVPLLLDEGEHLHDGLAPLEAEGGDHHGGGAGLALHAVNQHRGPRLEAGHNPRGCQP